VATDTENFVKSITGEIFLCRKLVRASKLFGHYGRGCVGEERSKWSDFVNKYLVETYLLGGVIK